MPNYWILKSEPSVYPFEQLQRDGRTVWDGIRNALALIHVRSMVDGDRALFYHSGDGRELVGLARIVGAPYADPKERDPKLVVVDLVPERALPRPVTLAAIKADPALADLALVRQSRLSVVPVSPAQWKRLLGMAGVKGG
jgi:predicted RNA-binding protein with PUA-like domain